MKRVILAVYAHPDDEAFVSGGTLAALAARGDRVVLLCATRGEVGEIADPALATRDSLPSVREQELRCSCSALGIEPPIFLNYRDSGMAGTEDNNHPNSLASADLETVIETVRQRIQHLKADIVITFDPHGGYGHPDHIAVHKAATQAFQSMQAKGGHIPGVLLYQVVPRNEMRSLAESIRELVPDSDTFRDVDWNQLGTPDEQVNLRVDVSGFVEAKLQALQCHQTQRNGWGPWAQLPRDAIRRFASSEYFMQAAPAPGAERREGTVEELFGEE